MLSEACSSESLTGNIDLFIPNLVLSVPSDLSSKIFYIFDFHGQNQISSPESLKEALGRSARSPCPCSLLVPVGMGVLLKRIVILKSIGNLFLIFLFSPVLHLQSIQEYNYDF